MSHVGAGKGDLGGPANARGRRHVDEPLPLQLGPGEGFAPIQRISPTHDQNEFIRKERLEGQPTVGVGFDVDGEVDAALLQQLAERVGEGVLDLDTSTFGRSSRKAASTCGSKPAAIDGRTPIVTCPRSPEMDCARSLKAAYLSRGRPITHANGVGALARIRPMRVVRTS